MSNELIKEHNDEYIQEMLQILEIIQDSISGLYSEPHREIINSLFRGFHAVKGNANLAKLKSVAGLASKFEDILSLIRAEVIPVDNVFIDTLNNSVDILRHIVRDDGQVEVNSAAEELLVHLNTILSDITSIAAGEEDDDRGGDSSNSFHTGLENRKVSEDIAAGVSVGGGGIALEIADGNNMSGQDGYNSCLVPKNAYRPLRILVVEDDFTSRQLLVAALSKYGECHVAKDGNEAVLAVEKSLKFTPPVAYDLICMDVQMPNMDGTVATKIIREIERSENVEGSEYESVIIMISCVEDPKVIIKSCYKCGANHYFVKPLDLNQMNRQMRKLGLIGDKQHSVN